MNKKQLVEWATRLSILPGNSCLQLPHSLGRRHPAGQKTCLSSFPYKMSIIATLTLCLFCAVIQARHRSPSSKTNASRITPVDLRCEYLSQPLGIDVKQPRLSWKLKAENPKQRGQAQTAYHILVARSKKQLAGNKGDLWDSGEVSSDRSHLVPYGGKPLSSSMRCFWKVRVRDEKGTLSSWSAPARLTMGFVKPSDFKAKWIGADETFAEVKKLPPEGKYLSDPWLRKVITLNRQPRWATIHVASVGYHELYVNGAKVTDAALMPNVADHTKRARYVTYDITDHLRAGRNAIGLWLGTAWSVYPLYKTEDKPQTPIVAAQAHIEMPGGKVRLVVTDRTWKIHPSPNALLGTWMFTNFGGEYYDAAKELPNWCGADLDDSNWKPVTVYQPRLTVSAEMVEPNRRVRQIDPVAVENVEGRGYRVDMGVNFAGFVELDVKGKPGDIIELQFSEDENKMITHKLHSAYRIGPGGRGTFRNRFNYGSGRWILIKGLKYKPALKDIRGYLIRTDYERAGWFECSNRLLNDIYDIVLWTFENLSVGAYVVDCPQRERMGYGGRCREDIDIRFAHWFYRCGGDEDLPIRSALVRQLSLLSTQIRSPPFRRCYRSDQRHYR